MSLRPNKVTCDGCGREFWKIQQLAGHQKHCEEYHAIKD